MKRHRLHFSPLPATKKACLDVPYEQAFLRALEKTVAYRLKEDTLLFLGKRKRVHARFVVDAARE
jgi:heat shock protein HslJ